jgi:hypothetical protein
VCVCVRESGEREREAKMKTETHTYLLRKGTEKETQVNILTHRLMDKQKKDRDRETGKDIEKDRRREKG